MKAQVFIHLDISTINDAEPAYRIFGFDASEIGSCNDYVLVDVKEIDFDPTGDFREQAIAKIDQQIKTVKATATHEASKLEARKAELLAIGNEVAA